MQTVGRKSDKQYGRNGQKYLRPEQVEVLIKAAARSNRHGLRDALMLSLAWDHALLLRDGDTLDSCSTSRRIVFVEKPDTCTNTTAQRGVREG